MAIDWILGWLKKMCAEGVIPPFCVEIMLKDGSSYFLHSIVDFEDETETMCARIWDLRAFQFDEIADLKHRLNEINDRKELTPPESVHPKLDWANLHVHYDDVFYCVEWHDRLWPEAESPKVGFTADKNS